MGAHAREPAHTRPASTDDDTPGKKIKEDRHASHLVLLDQRVNEAGEADGPDEDVAHALRGPFEANVVVLLVLGVLLDRQVPAHAVALAP